MLILKSRVLCLTIVLCAAVAAASAQKKGRQPLEEPRQKLSGEQNKVAARRVFEDLFTRGNEGAVEEIYARNCRFRFGNRTLGLGQAVAEGKGWRAAAPDLVMTADQISANGDVVIVTWSAKGTHSREGNGLRPTGKRVNMRGTTEFRFANGKIVEATTNEDYRPQLFRQLGVSKTAASMMDNTEKLWAAVAQLFPDPLYASLR
ncbi:MAG TPA: ester cyclase [Candidatus Angelobacter sp.]